MEPVTSIVLNDDYQDAKVLARPRQLHRARGGPLPAHRRGRLHAANSNGGRMPRPSGYLYPGSRDSTGMRHAPRAGRRGSADEIVPTSSNDRELGIRVALWLMRQTRSTTVLHPYVAGNNGPCGSTCLESQVRVRQGDPAWTVAASAPHELFGRSSSEPILVTCNVIGRLTSRRFSSPLAFPPDGAGPAFGRRNDSAQGRHGTEPSTPSREATVLTGPGRREG